MMEDVMASAAAILAAERAAQEPAPAPAPAPGLFAAGPAVSGEAPSEPLQHGTLGGGGGAAGGLAVVAAARAAGTEPRRARALYTFYGLTDKGELSFGVGAEILVLQRDHPQWWFGILQSAAAVRGWFPKTYVALLAHEDVSSDEVDGGGDLAAATAVLLDGNGAGIGPLPASDD
jgi:hypothetical protein